MRLWRILGALMVVTALASAAFASAAKLNVNSSGLQSGGGELPRCQGDAPVSVSYGTHYNNVIGFMALDTVTVSGIAPACVPAAGGPPTHTIKVVLTFGPPGCPPSCSQDLGTVPITGTTVVYAIPVLSQPAAVDVTDVHVVIM